MAVRMIVRVAIMGMDMKSGSRNILSLPAFEVEVDLISEVEGGNRIVENRLVHTEVAKGANSHVAADSRKTIEVENLHGNLWEGN